MFEKGASATDQSLIVAGRSIVVENNYGYTGPTSVMNGDTTAPGLERVDLGRDGRAAARVWRTPEIAPSVVPKLSLETGLVYTYTKPPRDDGSDAWYFTALDFCTGRTVYSRLAGTGLGYNNNFAPVTLGPGRQRVRRRDRRPDPARRLHAAHGPAGRRPAAAARRARG